MGSQRRLQAHTPQEVGIDGAARGPVGLHDQPGKAGPVVRRDGGEIQGRIGDREAAPAQHGVQIARLVVEQQVLGGEIAVRGGGVERPGGVAGAAPPPASQASRLGEAELRSQRSHAAIAQPLDAGAPVARAGRAQRLRALGGVGVQLGQEAAQGAGQARLVALADHGGGE